MGKYKRIPSDAWNISERVIMRYPQQKERYTDLVKDMVLRSVDNDGMPHGSGTSNPTERAAIELLSPYNKRLSREVNAVEEVMHDMRPEELEVIKARYWADRWKRTPYEMIMEPYSERQMHRIVFKFVYKIGVRLGEIE